MTLWDKLITVFLLTASVIAIVSDGFYMSGGIGERVVIISDNRQYASYDFNDITEKKTLNIEGKYGSNTVVIEKDGVYVLKADCPDKLDVKAGKISRQGQMIVCVPNRLMIEIKGGERKVDKVTY